MTSGKEGVAGLEAHRFGRLVLRGRQVFFLVRLAMVLPGPAHQRPGPLGATQGVEVGVGRQDVLEQEAFPLPGHTGAPADPEGHAGLRGRVGNYPGIVKLMALEHGARGKVRVVPGHFQDGIAVPLGFFAHDEVVGEDTRHGKLVAPHLDMLSQVHEAAAFGVDGQTGLGCGLDGIAEAQILGQGPGVGFGEAAADIEGVQVSREHRVVQGAESPSPRPPLPARPPGSRDNKTGRRSPG